MPRYGALFGSSILILFNAVILKGSQVCSYNNCDCGNLCIIVPGGYSCACPNGFLLGSDGKTCEKGFTKFALFVDRDSVNETLFQLSLDVPFPLVEPLPISANDHRPVAMDFDPEEERIYWADLQLPRIFRAFLNGSFQEVVIGSGLLSPAGLAVDLVGRNIYWTDFGNRNLEVAKLNGANRTVLAFGTKPWDILLDTDKSVMYWTDRGSVPVIEQANMDGTNRKVLVKYRMLFPNSLALDKLTNRLYWIDGGKAAVEYIKLDHGNTRVMFLQNNKVISHPFGLTMLDNYLYFTDWSQKAIVRVNMTSKHQEVIVRGLTKPGDIRAFRKNSSVTPRTFTTCSSTKVSTTPLRLETSVPILLSSTRALKNTVNTPNLKPLSSSSPGHRIATSIAPVATSSGRSSEFVTLRTNPLTKSPSADSISNTARSTGKSGKIAGAAVGGVIGLVFFIIIGVWFWRCRLNPAPSAAAQNATQTFGPSKRTVSSYDNRIFDSDFNEGALRRHDRSNPASHDPAPNVTGNPVYAPALTFPSTPQQYSMNNASLYYSVTSVVEPDYQKITDVIPHQYQELNISNLDRLRNRESNS